MLVHDQRLKMALPGLGLAVPLEPESQPSTIYEIEERMEWRFEIAFGLELEVKVGKDKSSAEKTSS